MLGHFRHTPAICNFILLWIVWVCSFIEPDLFDSSAPFDNTTPIYLISVLCVLLF